MIGTIIPTRKRGFAIFRYEMWSPVSFTIAMLSVPHFSICGKMTEIPS